MNNKEELQKDTVKVEYELDGQKIRLTPKIVQNYLVSGQGKITDQEFKLFTELCVVRKLNPFLKEAYIIKYSDSEPASMVVGKDAIEKRAVLNPKYDGMESGIIVIDPDSENPKEKIYVNGTFKLPEEKLVGGWARVYRKDWKYPSYCSVSLSESIQTKKDGAPNKNWSKQPATMIEKVAKVRALRSAFVEDLGGMYEAEEMYVDLPDVKPEERIINQIDEQEKIPEAEIEEKKFKQVSVDEL